jgi:preprotein translocase subunit SecB
MNTPVPNLPTSGYRILQIYAIRQSQELVAPETVDKSKTDRDVTFAWDWRIVDQHIFEVFLGLQVGASADVPETLHYGVSVAFELDEEPSIDIKSFVLTNSVATLLPFIREGLASLSMKGPFGAYYLPPLNATKIAADLNYADSTGAKQLAADPAALAPRSTDSDGGGA